MTTEISKKEAAALSAAIVVYLAKPRPVKTAATSALPEILESLLEKIAELEKRIDELNLSVNELRERVERIERR